MKPPIQSHDWPQTLRVKRSGFFGLRGESDWGLGTHPVAFWGSRLHLGKGPSPRYEFVDCVMGEEANGKGHYYVPLKFSLVFIYRVWVKVLGVA